MAVIETPRGDRRGRTRRGHLQALHDGRATTLSPPLSDGQAFLDLCLRRDPAARANAKSLLKHPFLEPKSDPAMLNATTAGVPEADDNWSTSASVVTRLGSVCSADAQTVDVAQSDGLESIGTQLDLDCSTQDNVAVACGDSNRTAKPVALFWAIEARVLRL